VVDFTYGYFEFREQIPDQSKGMFPAMWFYSANESADPTGKSTAEIDLYEIFGTPDKWSTTLHGAGTTDVGTQSVDTAGWHTYGMNWQKDTLQFFEDGKMVCQATPQQASYFNDLHMAVRVNFAMDAPWFPASAHSDSTTLSSMHMQIDYIRQYSELPFHPV
jgi:beta-glucanase (GH16 family)